MKYLHTMLRVRNLDDALHFYVDLLGLKEARRRVDEKNKYTLVFLYAPEDEALVEESKKKTGRDQPMVELTYNWNTEDYGEARHFGLTLHLRSRITKMDRPRSFVDEQVKGAFRSFVHVHEFAPEDGATRMIDDWHHEAPLGFLADRLFLERYMRTLLSLRNDVLKREAERQFGG